MWKWISAALFVSLVGTNGFWLYAAVDLLSIEKYRQLDEYAQCKRVLTLQRIVQSSILGQTKEALLQLLHNSNPDSRPSEKKGSIHVDFLSFPLDAGGEVVGIEIPNLPARCFEPVGR